MLYSIFNALSDAVRLAFANKTDCIDYFDCVSNTHQLLESLCSCNRWHEKVSGNLSVSLLQTRFFATALCNAYQGIVITA